MIPFFDSEIGKKADEPTKKAVNLWRALSKENTGELIEVMIGDKSEHPDERIRQFPRRLNVADPIEVDGRIVLGLYIEDERFEIITHEIGHWILSFQGFHSLIYRPEPNNGINMRLNSLAHHFPLYDLQKELGHNFQNEIDHRTLDTIDQLTNNGEPQRREERVEIALLITDDLLNCSPNLRRELRNALKRYRRTNNLIKKILPLAEKYNLKDPNDNLKFSKAIISTLDLGNDWYVQDDAEVLMSQVDMLK